MPYLKLKAAGRGFRCFNPSFFVLYLVMVRLKPWLIGTLTVFVLLIGFIFYFFSTGGGGLYRTVVYYLIPDLPDKFHSWTDFVYKGENTKVVGFYAGGDETSIKIWTLSGLKRFYAKPRFSTFSFLDTCSAVRQIKQSGSKTAPNNEQLYFDLTEFQELLQPENLVTVWPSGKEDGRVMIDKVLARSGQYKVLGRIEEGVCE